MKSLCVKPSARCKKGEWQDPPVEPTVASPSTNTVCRKYSTSTAGKSRSFASFCCVDHKLPESFAAAPSACTDSRRWMMCNQLCNGSQIVNRRSLQCYPASRGPRSHRTCVRSVAAVDDLRAVAELIAH